jgi:hypothetical protein
VWTPLERLLHSAAEVSSPRAIHQLFSLCAHYSPGQESWPVHSSQSLVPILHHLVLSLSLRSFQDFFLTQLSLLLFVLLVDQRKRSQRPALLVAELGQSHKATSPMLLQSLTRKVLISSIFLSQGGHRGQDLGEPEGKCVGVKLEKGIFVKLTNWVDLG